MLSKDPPTKTIKKTSGMEESMREVEVHIQKLKKQYHEFNYAAPKTAYQSKLEVKKTIDDSKPFSDVDPIESNKTEYPTSPKSEAGSSIAPTDEVVGESFKSEHTIDGRVEGNIDEEILKRVEENKQTEMDNGCQEKENSGEHVTDRTGIEGNSVSKQNGIQEDVTAKNNINATVPQGVDMENKNLEITDTSVVNGKVVEETYEVEEKVECIITECN